MVPRLVEAGHLVAGMTRTVAKVALLRDLGAEPIVTDVFDTEALRRAVQDFAPDVVIHELTDLPDDARRIPERAPAHARIRREGTQNLLAAARLADVERVLAQSVAWELSGDVGVATRDLERFVLDAGGVVLRYGRLYGPGTYYKRELPEPPRVHVDEAARLTVGALDAPAGIVTIIEA